jgi:hypothetical protein
VKNISKDPRVQVQEMKDHYKPYFIQSSNKTSSKASCKYCCQMCHIFIECTLRKENNKSIVI